MYGNLHQDFGQQESENVNYSPWWPFQPPPQSDYEILRDVAYEFVLFLWKTNLGLVFAASAAMVAAACLLIIAACEIWERRRRVVAPPNPAISMGKSLCHKCGLCEEETKSKKTQSHWKPNELTDTEEEEEEEEEEKELENCCVPLHKSEEGFYCTKKQLNATQKFNELTFEEAKDALNENKAISETSFEVPFLDHLGYDCCKKTSSHSFGTVTSEKLSNKTSRSTSSHTSQHDTFESSWTLSPASEQSFFRHDSLSRYTLVGTNTSDQFSSEEIWGTSSVSQTAPDERCFVTNKYLDKNTDSSGSGSTRKQTRYGSHDPEKYSVPSSYFKTDETIQLSGSGLKQIGSLAFFTELPPPDIYNLEEECAKVKNTNICSDPFVQKGALLTRENLEKFDLHQRRKKFQKVLSVAAKKLKIAKKNQGKTDKDWQMQKVYQTTPFVIPWLNETQVMTLELNVVQMALESQWGMPFLHIKSLSIMMPPLSSLPKKFTEPTMKEVKPPLLPENEVYDLEFNLQRRIGMQQWRPKPLKAVYPLDFANATKMKPQVPTFREKQAICLKLSLGKNVTHKWNGFNQCSVERQKTSETPLKDGSFVNTFKPKVENQLSMSVTKQHLENKLDHLPNVDMHSYEQFYCPVPNKHLPMLIRVRKGHKKPRTLNIHFLEYRAIDHLNFNLQQKRISNLWGSQNLFEKSLEMIIPKAPPVPPPIKARAAKIVPIAVGTDFIEEKARKHLESHITQRKPEFNWALRTEIQRSVVPPSPKLKHSEIKSQSRARFVAVQTEQSFISDKHKKTLEVNLSMPLGHEGGKSTAPQCEQAGKFMKAGSKRILPVPACLKSERKDKLDMCLINQCLDIKRNHLPSIVQGLHKNIDFSEPKATSSKLLTSGEGLKKARPGYIPFFESDALDHLEMNLKVKHISHLWGFQTLHEVSIEIMIPKAPPVLPAIIAKRAQIETVSMETTFLCTDVRSKLEWHTTQVNLQHNWGSPFDYQNSMETFIPAAPKLVPSQLNPQKMFGQLKRKKLTSEQCEGERRKSNTTNSAENFIFTHLKQEYKHKLDVCLIKQHLEIQMNILPEMVVKSYTLVSLPVSKITLPQLIVPRYGFKMRRASYISFIEKNAVERLELNFKHKQINHLWGQATLYIESLGMMIPSGPPVPPAIKAREAQIEPVGVDTPFIEVAARDILEWHITQKKLENNWGLPLHIRKSIDIHIPFAPRLVPCQLKQHCFYAATVIPEEPFFISSEHRKRLELYTKKKIINQKWGLPNLIQLSLKEQMAPSLSFQDCILISKIKEKIKTCPNSNVEFNSKMIAKHEKGKLLPPTHKVSKTENVSKRSDKLEKEYKCKLNICFLRQILNTKMHLLPAIVQECYQKSYPVALKKTLSKPLFVSEGLQKLRPRCLPFVKQDAINYLELNLKHKQIIYFWKFDTSFDRSMEMMIPKGPPVPPAIKASGKKIEPAGMEMMIPKGPSVPPAIKASGKKIEPEGMEISFIENDIRDRLNWHVTQKKLQQNWGRLPHIQISAELFILPAPKLIPSQLNLKPSFWLIVNPNELQFLKNEHQKLLEFNIKKKKINQIWGLSTVIQSSLKNIWGLNGLRSDRFLQSKIKKARNAGLSNIDKQSKFQISSQKTKMRTIPLQHKTTGQNTKPSKTKIPDIFTTVKQKSINKLDVCLKKSILEIKLHCLPEIIQQFYQENYPSTLEKPVDKITVPGEGCKITRSLYIAFIEQDAVDCLELNQKHELIVSLWGLATQSEKSIEIMILKGPPMPPTIKSCGAKIEPEGMETFFISDKVRENLEWSVVQKKLQATWDLPLSIQGSEEALIPFAPKLILSQLKPHLRFSAVVLLNELEFLYGDHKKILELNTKKKIINSKFGHPKLIQSSMNRFAPVSADLDSLSNTDNNESKTIPQQRDINCDRSKKTRKIDDLFCSNFKPEWTYIVEMCVIKLCLEIKIGIFPELVTKFYKSTYPSPSNMEGLKKTRPCYLRFVEQNALDRLDLNLKHHKINHLLKVTTLHDKSKEIMIPKGPPMFPTIKGSGARIFPVQMEISFVENEVKDKLEWHITQKKFQDNFGLPLLIQKSQEAFIHSPPKLIPSQSEAQHEFILLFDSSELSFLSSEHRKSLELIAKKRIINYKWGLPKAVQHSLNNFMPLFSLQSEMMERNEVDIPMNTPLQAETSKLPSKQNQKCSGVPKPEYVGEGDLPAEHQAEWKDRLEFCLIKQCLDLFLPNIARKMHEVAYSPISKIQLPKIPLPKPIAPGKGFKRPRSSYVPFIEQAAVAGKELNFKHKHITHLWGTTTLFKESFALMIAREPPDPPGIKASGAKIENIGLEICFIDSEIKKSLEWHISQQDLEHNWGDPLHIQISKETFIPRSPKLIASQQKPQPCFNVLICQKELTFITNRHQQLLKQNVKKWSINCTRGLPKSVQLSEQLLIHDALQMKDFAFQSQEQPTPMNTTPPSAGSLLWMENKKLLSQKSQHKVKSIKAKEDHEVHTPCSINNFTSPAPSIKKDMHLLRTGERSTAELKRYTLSNIDIIETADQKSMTNTSCRDFDKSSNVYCMEQPFACPKEDVSVAKHIHAGGIHHVSQHPVESVTNVRINITNTVHEGNNQEEIHHQENEKLTAMCDGYIFLTFQLLK